MSGKNTVTRVSAPDTTEGTKRRNAEIAARKREEDRPKLERQRDNITSLDPDSNHRIDVLQKQTDKEIYGSDSIPFALKGGNTRTRLDAKGGQSADVRAATKGGDGGNETQVETLVQGSTAPVSDGGPRIVVNPSTFHNEKDALCVAFDEAFRVVMEANGFEPQSEPTEAQRKFFSDTAYANDELMLRRTILARICTFDTSVKDPTDEQLQEAVEFLDTVMEIGAPQNEWEQNAVQRIRDVIASSVGKPGETSAPPSQSNSGTEAQAAVKGGKTEEEEKPKVEESKSQGNGGTEGQPSGQPQAAQNPNVNQQAPIPTDYRDTDGTWRTKTGQLIGNDDQKKEYDQAKTALAGTNSYYDNGVFRTQTGAKIGGDLASVQQYAKILNGEKGTGSYYDAGVWRTATGARLDISKYQDQPQANTNAAPAKAQAPAVQAPATQPPAQTTVNQPATRTAPQGRKLTAAEEAFMANRDKTRLEAEQRRAIGDVKRGEIGASDDKVRTSVNEGAVTETDDDADKYYIDPITGQRKKKNRI